jgi:hypothetical protein
MVFRLSNVDFSFKGNIEVDLGKGPQSGIDNTLGEIISTLANIGERFIRDQGKDFLKTERAFTAEENVSNESNG